MPLFPRIYDLAMAFGERGRMGELRSSVVSPARGRILEIGAGTGLDFPHYRTGAWVIATDPDWAMLELARVRAREAEAEILLVLADAQGLPFRDAAFDEVVVALTMCTIPDPRRALDELRRALKPDGVLRMLEHVRIEHPAIVGRVQDRLTPLWRHIAKGCHLNRRTVAAVVAAGFAIETTTSHLGGYMRTITARTPPMSPVRTVKDVSL